MTLTTDAEGSRMSDSEVFGGIEPPIRAHASQLVRPAYFVIHLMKILSEIAPGDEEVERLRDYHRTIIGGVYMGVAAIFGDEGVEELKELVAKTYRKKAGSEPPSIVPRVMVDGAQTGIFKRQIHGDLGWTFPDDTNI